eukprot:5543481-Amphidinium_carterae.1
MSACGVSSSTTYPSAKNTARWNKCRSGNGLKQALPCNRDQKVLKCQASEKWHALLLLFATMTTWLDDITRDCVPREALHAPHLPVSDDHYGAIHELFHEDAVQPCVCAPLPRVCLLYTSDAADDTPCVDL